MSHTHLCVFTIIMGEKTFNKSFTICFYPMVRTDPSKVGSCTRAEVEGSHREAMSLQTHHVGTAGSAILHITKIRAVLQECMAAPE